MAVTLPMLPHLRRLIDPSALDLGRDAVLLSRFVHAHDEAAFAVLVARHGPMVLRVCRRVLGDVHTAEDVCQAVFLVLVRKAAGIHHAETLAAWLHGVAHRLALKARAVETRRRQAETHSLQSVPSSPVDPLTEVSGRELLTILDAELQHLPERYRLPLILCCLEGHSQPEAARLLGWTPGSVKGRLECGRAKLHQRLLRRGLTLPAALLALESAQGAAAARMPAALTTSIVRAISGGVSAGVAALAEGGIAGMIGTKMKLVFLFVLAFGAVTASVGLLTQPGLVAWPAEEKPAAQPNTDLPKAAQPKPAKEQARVDRYGDPLPHNALLRLGTVRLRAMAFRFAFLPGDKRLVSVGAEEENVGQVWDINTGRVVRRLEMGNGYLASSAFTPDGKMVALAYTDKKTSYLLYVDTATGKEFRRHNMPAHRVIGALAFTPDGRTLAGWCDDETIRLWDAATGREIRQTKERQAYVTVLTISPDAQTLASAGADRTIRLWDVKTGAEQHKIEGFPGQIWSLAFAPDGTTLASVGKDDKTIRLWDVKTGQLRRRLEGHQDAPHRVTFSPDGKLLASAAASPLDDHSIRLWDAATGRLLRRIDGSGYWGTACLVISSDGKKLAASGGDHTIRLWDTATGEELHARGEQQSWVLSVTYSPNGKMLATGCQDETIRLWDASTGALLHRFRGDKGGVSQVIFSPDGKTLATSGRDKIVRLLDQTSGKELRRFKASQGSEWWFITSLVAFSPDGKIVATTGANHTIRLWSVRTGELLQRLEHKAEIHSIAFSPDGKFLASGEGNFPLPDNGIVRLWEIASGREVRHWSPEGTRWFDTVNFSPDGKTIAAVGCYSPSIYLWDTATGEERRRLVLADKTWSVALAFSPDGRTLATGSEDHLIRLWETATGKERRRFVGHQARIRSLAFSPDGRLLASGSDDTTALIWDVTGRSTTAPDRALSAEELRALWDELASKDAGKAFDAIGLLTAKPEMALPLLKEKLRTAPAPADRQQVARLIAELDDEQFSVRQKAREELRRLDERAEPGLQEALKGKLPLETRKRIEELLEGVRVSAVSPEKLRPFRAVEVLEHVGTAAARDVLKTLAEGASEARLTREAKASLQRLTSRAALEP